MAKKEVDAKIMLKGSCHCQAVRFTLKSAQVYPYQRCYCSICRKTQGGGGFAINLAGDRRTLKVKGDQFIKIYHARMKAPGDKRAHRSSAERHFCGKCGSALWLFDKDWPELIHPFASAIDTPLPTPPESTHLLLDSKPAWVTPQVGPNDKTHGEFPDESIADWHARLNKTNRI